MIVQRRWACRNTRCARYGVHRDGQGACQGCGWMTVLAAIWTVIS